MTGRELRKRYEAGLSVRVAEHVTMSDLVEASLTQVFKELTTQLAEARRRIAELEAPAHVTLRCSVCSRVTAHDVSHPAASLDNQLAEARRRIERLEKELALALLHGKNIVAGLRHLAQSTAVSDGEFRSLLRQRLDHRDEQ